MLWEPQKTSDGTDTHYGIGWGTGVDDAGRFWAGHTGGSVGGSTFFRIYAESGLVIAMISNASSVTYNGLPIKIADLFIRAME
jgi:hypothetical protein